MNAKEIVKKTEKLVLEMTGLPSHGLPKRPKNKGLEQQLKDILRGNK